MATGRRASVERIRPGRGPCLDLLGGLDRGLALGLDADDDPVVVATSDLNVSDVEWDLEDGHGSRGFHSMCPAADTHRDCKPSQTAVTA